MRYLILLLCLQTSAVFPAVRVVTSIAPLQEITAEIMAGVAVPGVIIADPVSVHHFAFKPSQMRLLQQADLVIWVDRSFEAGFSRMPEILPQSTRLLELMPALGIADGDGHIWYSSQLLIRSTEIIADALMQLDPEHQVQYLENASRLAASIKQWRHNLRLEWQNRKPRYVTDHAFSAHFEADTGFTAIASIHNQHDDHGGLRELNRIEDLLHQNPAACLLTFENPASSLAQSMAQKYRMRIIELTSNPAADPRQPRILQRLDRLTTALFDCI